MGCLNGYYWDGCGLENYVEPGDAATTFYPSAYSQDINAAPPTEPLARYEEPVGPHNVADADLKPADIGGGMQNIEYIAAWIRQAPIGVFTIGEDGISIKNPYHGFLVTVNGVDTETQSNLPSNAFILGASNLDEGGILV